jgi:hypothetical protein
MSNTYRTIGDLYPSCTTKEDLGISSLTLDPTTGFFSSLSFDSLLEIFSRFSINGLYRIILLSKCFHAFLYALIKFRMGPISQELCLPKLLIIGGGARILHGNASLLQGDKGQTLCTLIYLFPYTNKCYIDFTGNTLSNHSYRIYFYNPEPPKL